MKSKAVSAVSPFMCFRPSPALDSQIRELCQQSGMTISSVLTMCLEAHLPIIKKHQNHHHHHHYAKKTHHISNSCNQLGSKSCNNN